MRDESYQLKYFFIYLLSETVEIEVIFSPHFGNTLSVVRHAAKIAHKVCENRKIYLKFLNKPNFNVPKNWGKIFGKTA